MSLSIFSPYPKPLAPAVLISLISAAFTPDPDPARNNQITRAAALVCSALRFSNAIREDRFPLEDLRGVPQCMNQYWWLFGVTRVPQDDGGRLRMDVDARHIMVLCRGQIYRLTVLEEDTYKIIDEHDLAASLQQIVDETRTLSRESAAQTSIGAFTTENQRTWARCRTELVHGSVRNGRNIGAIDSSLFALCLDDSSPEGDEDICRNMICGTTTVEKDTLVGTCLNRWYDKLAVIVCRNGAAGMNFEHTCTDGSADIRMACEIYQGSLAGASPTSNGSPSSGGGVVPNLKKLEWDIPSAVAMSLQSAQTHLVDRIHAHQLAALNFSDYGKAFIKTAGVSPDAYFQMILHAAYYSIAGQVGNGFEPVLTRSFLHGRTDVARTLTPACAAFARVYNDKTAAPTAKIEALRAAAVAHVTKFKDCAQGNSHHRHLYVLQLLWKRRRATLQANRVAVHLPATTIFTDPGWARLGTTVLMGSNVDNPSIAYAGFGPPSADGFTVCYYIRDNMIAFSVNSRNGRAHELTEAIERTLKTVRAMIEDVGKA